jgi:hypothetical protein
MSDPEAPQAGRAPDPRERGEFVTTRDVFDEETEARMDREDLAKQRARMASRDTNPLSAADDGVDEPDSAAHLRQ